jgi:hypothetical protein
MAHVGTAASLFKRMLAAYVSSYMLNVLTRMALGGVTLCVCVGGGVDALGGRG